MTGITIAAAPVSWGVFEQTDADKGLSPEEMLDQMVAAGYAGTELGPPRPSSAAACSSSRSGRATRRPRTARRSRGPTAFPSPRRRASRSKARPT